MSDLAELQRKQAETARQAMRVGEETDPQRILELAAEVQRSAQDLEKMARSIEARFAAPAGGGEEVRVVLTPEQRARIAGQTGVGIETVTLHDTPQKSWSAEMRHVEPRVIEREAAKEAARVRLVSETRTQVERIIRQLEALEVPELAETIAELKRDPTLGRGKGK